jgi:hypothetical protein
MRILDRKYLPEPEAELMALAEPMAVVEPVVDEVARHVTARRNLHPLKL